MGKKGVSYQACTVIKHVNTMKLLSSTSESAGMTLIVSMTEELWWSKGRKHWC